MYRSDLDAIYFWTVGKAAYCLQVEGLHHSKLAN